jgi:DNA-binding transcriptional LysR family regulator
MLDCDDLRFFLAIIRRGSLSAAAKDLHVAQSTVGRRLASLEASLSVRLLNRTPDEYVLTLAGQVCEQAERRSQSSRSMIAISIGLPARASRTLHAHRARNRQRGSTADLDDGGSGGGDDSDRGSAFKG